MKKYGAVPNWIILMIFIPILFVWYIFLGSIYKIGKKIFFTENFDKCKIRKSKKNNISEEIKQTNKNNISDEIRNYFDKLMMPILSKKIPGFDNFPDKIKNKIITPSLIAFKNNIMKNKKFEKLNILLKDKSEKEKKLFFKKIFNVADMITS